MPRTVRIRSLRLSDLRIPFKVAFRHASAERHETSSLWVEGVSEGGAVGYGESCPRQYVTGETIDTARAFFASREASWRDEIVSLPSLRAWMATHAEEVDANPAAWCAIELAVLNLFAREHGLTIEAFLGLSPLTGPFHYSAVLGDADIRSFQSMTERYRRQGFTDFKVKLSGNLEHDRQKLAFLSRSDGTSLRVRVDANNLWEGADEAIAFLRALDYPIFAVEEPIRPNRYSELGRIGAALGCQIVLDESFLRIEQMASLRKTPIPWIINLRVSKMGGLLRSLPIVEAARASGIGLIVGAQVGETSLLTRAALTIAQAAGGTLVAQEGGFGTLLLERDVCDPPLMFGAGGVLDVSSYSFLTRPGLGLEPRAQPTS